MKKEGFYSSGTFAEMAHVSKKTLRYYNDKNILKPSYVDEHGAKYYTDNDFAKLQQILFLKYLSFPLADIKELTVRGADREFWLESLKMQTGLLDEHIEQMTVMKKSLKDAEASIKQGKNVDWSKMLALSNADEMEQKLKKQYINSSNISARIYLHSEFSENKEGWFPWLFRMADISAGAMKRTPVPSCNETNPRPLVHILELGCGDGSFWTQNADKIPQDADIIVSDISNGIVRETGKKLSNCNGKIKTAVIDAHSIPAKDSSFDLLIANHMLFYCEDIKTVLSEIKRVLKPGGRLLCSTYSSKHMQEVSRLVKAFDNRIALSADVLYENFGKENGKEILSEFFTDVNWQQYEDTLIVTRPEPLISYILSCHGNQNRYIVDKYHDFFSFVKAKTDKGFTITKDAGAFICTK